MHVLPDLREQRPELLVLAVLTQQLWQQILLLLAQEGKVLYPRTGQLGDHFLLRLPLLQLRQQGLGIVDCKEVGQFAGVLDTLDAKMVLLQPPLESVLLLGTQKAHLAYLPLIHDETQLGDLLLRQLVDDGIVIDKLHSKWGTSLIEGV